MGQKVFRVWETLSRKTILEHGKFLKVENHVIELPNGTIIPDWAWIIIPDAAIVLPVTPEGKFLCFRQTKYAVQGTSLAPVGGMIEENEDPFDAAKRELSEEMGCEASNWINLGSYVLDPNRGIATMHLFLALDARQITSPDSDDLEDCLLYTSPSPRGRTRSRMPSSACKKKTNKTYIFFTLSQLQTRTIPSSA